MAPTRKDRAARRGVTLHIGAHGAANPRQKSCCGIEAANLLTAPTPLSAFLVFVAPFSFFARAQVGRHRVGALSREAALVCVLWAMLVRLLVGFVAHRAAGFLPARVRWLLGVSPMLYYTPYPVCS